MFILANAILSKEKQMLKQIAGTTAPLHCILAWCKDWRTQSIFSKLGSAPKICFKWASDDGNPQRKMYGPYKQ